MSEMRQSQDGGHQQPSPSSPAQEAPWLEDLNIYDAQGEVCGWASHWRMGSLLEKVVVVIPLLHLAQETTYQLVHVRGYLDVFRDARLCGPGLNMVPFQMYGAEFMLYRTGKPELHNMITSLHGGTADIAKIIRFGASLLT